MGRPRSLVYKNLSLYNKNHSEKVKMYFNMTRHY